jgi:hypothetical protein
VVVEDRPSRPRDGLGRAPRAEVEALAVLVNRRDEILGALDEVLFDDERTLAAYRVLRDHQGVHDAIEAADGQVSAMLSRLAVEDNDSDAADVLTQLIRAASLRAVRAVEARLRAQPDNFDELPIVEWLMHRVNELDDPSTATEAAEQLLRWLTMGAEGATHE